MIALTFDTLVCFYIDLIKKKFASDIQFKIQDNLCNANIPSWSF